MLKKKHFRYRDIDALRAEIAELGLSIRLEEKIEKLLEPVQIGHKVAGNAFGIHPMEGCDGTLDGKPSELTIRRWERFGRGGAKLIWGEATALFDEVKSNSRQLVINDETASSMESILNLTRNAHREEFGSNEEIIVGMQLTHSGRYSYQKPLIAFRHPVVDKVTLIDKKNKIPIPEDYPVLTDDYLERQEDIFVAAAKLAWKTGFDFVDLKQCHTYLLSELLAAKTREGKYGGSFENRTRFIRNIVGKIRAEVGDGLILATRLNVYDGVAYMEDPETTVGVPRDIPTPYRYGFGVDENDPPQPDMTEPIKLVGILKELGVKLINVTTGSPYFNPHIGRPFERPPIDGYETPEHPLIGVDRHIRLTGEIQQAYPDLPVVGTGYSWLQQYLVNAAEANVRDGRVSFVAVGRGALAYPDYARDTITMGEMVKRKVCVAVSYCTALMRAKANPLGQFAAGCVPRDKIYAPIYKEAERTLTKRS